MSKFERTVCFLVCVLFSLYGSSHAINCYQCTGSATDKSLFQCNEWLDTDVDIEPESCDDVYDAKYCIKHIGRFEGDGIKCFQCSSGENITCSDGMISMGGIEPKSCDHVFEARYCIKSTGLYGGIGAKRFCSSLDMGNYCNYVRQPGDNLESYRTCIFTCTGDGCNGSSNTQPTMILFLTFLFLVIHLR